ncbi:MAG TPA: TetR/AcrR family transcriptional regulator [Burkholderiales bacterium]
MATASTPSLPDRRNELTRRLILESALQVLERSSFGGLTMGSVAKRARMSLRTVFRYFPTREVFLDAIAEQLRLLLGLPPPQTVDELVAFPRALYTGFEAHARLMRAALHSELYDRMRETAARARWEAVRRIVDSTAPGRSDEDRKVAAANIRFYLGASTWHYYRAHFDFTLEEAIRAAETAIRQSLEGLRA